jgi:prepilin-type processing-associated H-X9-DG protein
LNKAREAAKDVVCKSNLRQCGLALLMYAQENRQYLLPPAAVDAHGVPLPGNGPWSANLNKLGYLKGYGATLCPSWDPFRPLGAPNTGLTAYMGYAMVSGYQNYEFLNINQAWNPSRTDLMTDSMNTLPPSWSTDLGHGVIQYYFLYKNHASAGATLYLHMRHNGHANMLFMDGHVEAINKKTPIVQVYNLRDRGLTTVGAYYRVWE